METTYMSAPDAEREVKLEVLSAESRVSEATGAPYVSFKMRVVGTRHHLFDNLSLKGAAGWRRRQFAEGFLPKRTLMAVLSGDQGLDPQALVGRTAKATIRFEPNYRSWMVKEVHPRA